MLVTYRVLPDNKLLGPKYGARFPALRNALASLGPSEVAASVLAGETVKVNVDSETLELTPGEILVQTQPVEGLAVASDKLITVAVDAVITTELRQEGLGREIVRRIQDMRKKAGFNIEDRITTYYAASGELASVFKTWSDYIQAETLTSELVEGEPPAEAYREEQQVEAETVVLGVKR
jgi:isoleucyl-tRNA synthetase